MVPTSASPTRLPKPLQQDQNSNKKKEIRKITGVTDDIAITKNPSETRSTNISNWYGTRMAQVSHCYYERKLRTTCNLSLLLGQNYKTSSPIYTPRGGGKGRKAKRGRAKRKKRSGRKREAERRKKVKKQERNRERMEGRATLATLRAATLHTTWWPV